LRAKFNTLSWPDRLKLHSAALMNAVTGIARDDCRQNPWRYPFYAGFIGFIMAPIPVPGANIVPMLLLVGVARTRLTPWARMADDRLMRAFNRAAVMEDHQRHVEPKPEEPARLRVRNLELARESTRQSVGDMYDATRAGWRALKRVFT
jgi:hypothetical protein